MPLSSYINTLLWSSSQSECVLSLIYFRLFNNDFSLLKTDLIVFFNLFQANTFVFIMVLRTMLNSHKVKQEDAIGKVRTGVKAAVVIFPILGLTWVFGLMTFNRETLFFRYLFAIFNSSQGMLIFLFHCVLNKQVMKCKSNFSCE